MQVIRRPIEQPAQLIRRDTGLVLVLDEGLAPEELVLALADELKNV